MTNSLSLSNFINVTIVQTTQGLQVPNINTAALFSTETPSWAGEDDFKIYLNASDVATDFGSESSAFGIANAFFSQNPNPLSTGGYLSIIVLPKASVVIQDLTYTAKVRRGDGNTITIAYTTGGTAGSEVVSVTGKAISVQIQSGVSTATQIRTAVLAFAAAAALVDVTVTGTGSHTQTAPVSAKNLSGGSIENTIIATTEQVYYTGVLVDEDYYSSPSVLQSLSNYVQTLDKLLFISSSHAQDYAVDGIFDDIRSASNTHTRCLYYHGETELDSRKMAAAYAGRALSTDFSGTNTAITMHGKSLATILPDQTVTQTDLQTCQQTGVDVYCSFRGIPKVFTSGANTYYDSVYNNIAFKLALETAGFNYLTTTSTKIPQTDSGMRGLANSYGIVCQQFVNNGVYGPGTWNSPDVFGNPESLIRNVADFGYYIYYTPITQQSQVDRERREAPLVQIAVKEQGATQKSNTIVKVNK